MSFKVEANFTEYEFSKVQELLRRRGVFRAAITRFSLMDGQEKSMFFDASELDQLPKGLKVEFVTNENPNLGLVQEICKTLRSEGCPNPHVSVTFLEPCFISTAASPMAATSSSLY